MKKHEMEAVLFCIRCKDEVPHQITYVNNKISSINCEECNHTVEINRNMLKEFYDETYQRIATKPNRITQEYRESLSHFLFSLPIRLISKPYRLVKDIKESQKIIKEYSDKSDKK